MGTEQVGGRLRAESRGQAPGPLPSVTRGPAARLRCVRRKRRVSFDLLTICSLSVDNIQMQWRASNPPRKYAHVTGIDIGFAKIQAETEPELLPRHLLAILDHDCQTPPTPKAIVRMSREPYVKCRIILSSNYWQHLKFG
ncbi:hypothetical protein MG293_014907 [Ovis ammon polii]|uniref:Uncharacterized protein n=1 Tax=Ovis ammon polii TaxID=230172 RepID=A0AAD4TTM0_OVIAM|nr:hypothetical protein MG293_014907 [Ovis ammon polii]